MKTYIKILVTFSLILFLCNAAFPGEDIIIESRLFKGTKHERLSQEEIIISSLSEPFIVPVRSTDIENEKWTVESMQRELRNLYQLQQVDHLASANMIWDGKKKNLTKTILLERSLLPIEFYPEIVSDQSANLRIRVSQMFGEGMKLTADSMRLEKERMAWVISGPLEITSSEMNVRELLDTEITLNFNQTVVLGFPMNGTSYFLEVRINNKKEARNFSGVKDKYKEYTEMVKTDMDFLQPPNPVREVRPVYPKKCKEKNIEGAVILQVGIDAEGNVINVELLKGAHKNLDQAAVEALRLWKYQPVKKDGEPVPVTFTVTVDFKLRKAINNQKSETPTKNQKELEKILEKCAEYCERLENSSLYFVCEEAINEEIRSRNSALPYVERNRYIYDYQLIIQGDSIEEQRILLKENGQEKDIVDAQLKTKRFHHKYIVFGPIGLLGQKQQKDYEYKILKEVIYKREKAVILEASPKFPHEFNALYGKVWIRKKDFNILKIEWEQESMENFEEIEKIAEWFKAKPKITFVSEFGFEENKIRFPNKYFVKEVYILPKGRRYMWSETTVVYDNYKFFPVDTEVKY